MQTKIHTTKKLEKLIKKLIGIDTKTKSGLLGKWNATVFYVDRKKCWLLTNGLTKYNIILPDIKASDLKRIEEIIISTLYAQLKYDGIMIKFESLRDILGSFAFLPTDNDRNTTGFQNQRLYELDWWRNDYENLESMPIIELTSRMNKGPIRIGKGYTMSAYTNSVDEMKKLIV